MSDYASKINALLAKADATTHEGERVAFTEAAERLMVKWGIDEAMLDDAAKREKAARGVQIEERRYTIAGPSGALLAELVGAQAARGVAPVRTLIVRGRPVWFAIGYTDDLARVELYVPHIVDQARDAWKRHLVERRGWYCDATDRNRARVAFLDAFGVTVQDRLGEVFRAAQDATGTALVLAGRADAVDAKHAELHPGIKTARQRRSWDRDAAADGCSAGQRASLAAGALAG